MSSPASQDQQGERYICGSAQSEVQKLNNQQKELRRQQQAWTSFSPHIPWTGDV